MQLRLNRLHFMNFMNTVRQVIFYELYFYICVCVDTQNYKHLFVSYIYLLLLSKQNAQLGFIVTCPGFDDTTWHMQNKRSFSGYTVSCSHCNGSALCVTDKQPCIALKSPSSYVNFGHIKTMKYIHRTYTNTIYIPSKMLKFLRYPIIECHKQKCAISIVLCAFYVLSRNT